jgi:hypothetical protein
LPGIYHFIRDGELAKRESLKMRQAEPDRIEYCLLSGKLVDPFSIRYPYGHEISFGHCLALAQQCLSTYWRHEGGTLRAQRKYGKATRCPRWCAWWVTTARKFAGGQ